MWVIYYSTWDVCSLDVEPQDVPTRDVQVIVQSNRDAGWITQTGTDYYVWIGYEWRGVDHFGLWDYLAQSGWKLVLFGRTLTSSEYDDIMSRALNDKRLPEKTSGGRRERWVRL